jgi:hypothetical protein
VPLATGAGDDHGGTGCSADAAPAVGIEFERCIWSKPRGGRMARLPPTRHAPCKPRNR